MKIKACSYVIRHTFATEAIIRGVDLVPIATLMRHSVLTMLQKIYQHVGKKRDHLKASLAKAIGQDTSAA